jgi:hypothetical protein
VDVGITQKQYTACENIDFFNQWTSDDLEEQVKLYGFATIDAYRVVAVRCHIYNLIKACRKEKLATVLTAYGCSVASGQQQPPFRYELNTLFNTLAHVSVKTLFKVGWTFWSIPLGTF